jgi:hypothetical protein
MFPISGRALLYLKLGRQFLIVLLIMSNVAHQWNYKENSELLGYNPVSMHLIHNGSLLIEAGSLR